MATKITCDICEKLVKFEEDKVRVEFDDGEHPHSGSTMSITKDVCFKCLVKIKGLDIRVREEWYDVRKELSCGR